MKKNLFIGLTMLTTVSVASSVCASPVTFFGQDTDVYQIPHVRTNSDAAQADFLAALTGGYITEDFEGFALNSGAPLALDFFGFGTSTLLGGGKISDNDTELIGRWATSGTKYWDTPNVFTITFSQPVYAFGFYATDIGDGRDGRLVINYTTSSGVEVLHVNNAFPTSNGGVLYFGFYENDPLKAFTSISFTGASSLDYFGFDDMTVGKPGDPVPEPATMLLLGAGIVGLAGLRSRRKKVRE